MKLAKVFLFFYKAFTTFILFTLSIILFPRLVDVSALASANFDLNNTSNYNIRFKGAAVADKLGRFDSISVVDIDGDGIKDIIVGAERADNNGRTDSGSLYYINGILFNSLVGTGNAIDLSDSSNYTIRYDGATPNGRFGYARAFSADINNNGKPDVISAAFNENNNGRTASGSIYVIYDTLIDDYVGMGNNVDMASSSNWNLRIDGASANDNFGTYTHIADLDNNGNNDLILNAVKTDYNARSSSGSVWIMYDSLIDNYSGTGNTIDMSNSANYNLRYDGSAASESIGDPDVNTADVDNDGKLDILIGSVTASRASRSNSGNIYVIFNSLIDNYTGTGNNIDLATSSNYNLLYYGAANEKLAVSPTTSDDINSDGKIDLILGGQQSDYNSRTDSGSIYVIYSSLLDDYSGTGNSIDLTNSENYNIRFDGAVETSALSYHYIALVDVDNDGKPDMVASAYSETNNSRLYSGSLYIFYNTLFSSYSGTGNTVDTVTNYSVRYDGATDWILFPGGDNTRFEDINNDGKLDVIAGAAYLYTADADQRDAGYVYIIYNFPHTITVGTSSNAAASSVKINGTVSAPNSTTSVAGVQYSVDNNSPSSSSWTSCGGTTTFTCSVNNLSLENHNIYIRAYDSSGSYTSQSHYYVYRVGSPNTTSTDPNCRPGFKHCINAGPNYSKNTSFIQTFVNNSWAGAIIPNYANHDDMYITIKRLDPSSFNTLNIPYPWSQGLNTYSDVYQFSAISAFNGYPISKTDKPFTIQIPYDGSKLEGISPLSLKISYLDTKTNKWKYLSSPTVIDKVNNIVSTTTQNLSSYVLTYPSVPYPQTLAKTISEETPTQPIKDSSKDLQIPEKNFVERIIHMIKLLISMIF